MPAAAAAFLPEACSEWLGPGLVRMKRVSANDTLVLKKGSQTKRMRSLTRPRFSAEPSPRKPQLCRHCTSCLARDFRQGQGSKLQRSYYMLLLQGLRVL